MGSLGGKYGAKTHFSAHLRRRILHAAQGLTTTARGAGGGGEDEEEGETEREDGEVMVVAVVVSLDTIFSDGVE